MNPFSFFETLTQREKNLLLMAICFLLPAILFQGIFIPIQNYQKKLSHKTQRIETKIKKIQLATQEIKYLQIRVRDTVIPLEGKINRLLQNLKLRGHSQMSAGSRTQGLQKVILRMDELTLHEISQVIFSLENHLPAIRVSRLEMKPSFKNIQLMQVAMILTSR
ncbi:MAG: hypothetical protein ACI86H_000228 [bacterium]